MNWLIWRPVVAGLDTLSAVCTRWTVDQVLDAHELLDMREDAERKAMQPTGAMR